MAINFRGYLFKDNGDPVESATVQLLNTGTTTVKDTFSGGTTSAGLWYFSEADQDKYDVKITSGSSSTRYIRWDDQISVKEVDVRNDTGATTPAATFTNLTNATANQVAVFSGANTTRADGDEIYLSFKLADSAGNIDEFARMTVDAADVTSGEEDGQIRFSVAVDGTLTDVFTINSSESGGTDMTLDVSGDLTLDADGGDILFKDGGTTFGSATNTSGNLIIKSGTTTALTFSGANVTFAGTVDATTDFTIGDTVITNGVITDSTGLQLAANLDIDGTADISGDLTLSGGADGALQFTNAGENSIKIPDNQASALIIEEANNAYITFVTTNSSEAITVAKATTFSAGIANSGTIAAGTWNGTAIATSYIAADAITGAKIADDAIDSEHYTDGSIDTAHLAADAVTGAKIADDAIDSEHYTDGSIDTAHIADNQVTLAKMAGITRGSIIYGDASGDPAALAVGSANYVLTSDGTDAAWAAVSSAAVTAVANGSDNRISTFSSSTALNGEANLTFNGSALQVTGTLTVGVDGTGHDVKFFGASAGAYLEWDKSADQLRIMGASADATTSTGKLLLATSLTDINANDVIGKVEFQAPHEAGGTDAITVAASIQAIAQATFSSSVNATDLIFYTGHSEAATEKFRFTSQGEIGIGGANYGTDGQVLTSGGAGAAPAWEDAAGISGLGSTDNAVLRANGTGGATAQGSSAIITDGGSMFIGDTAHSGVTTGLVFNQGAADDIVFALKSSDIDHGLTSGLPNANMIEADDYFVMKKGNVASGGVLMESLCENVATGGLNLIIEAVGATAHPTKSSSGRSLVEFYVAEHDGSNALADITANGNIFNIRARVGGSDVTRMIVDEDGDLYSTTSAQTFDEYDDAHMVRALDQVKGDVIRDKWDDYVQYNEQALIDADVLGAPVSEGGLTNVTQLQRLHNGAIWQGYTRQMEMQERMEVLENKLLAIEGGK